MTEPDTAVVFARRAHERLLDHLDSLSPAAGVDPSIVARPSRLPGWTIGHVLAHLALNADSQVRVIDGAARGEVWEQYEGGMTARTAAIETAAAAAWADQLARLRSSIALLDSAWTGCAAGGWAGAWRSPLGSEVPIADLAFRRWREVEVHHADLGLDGFTHLDWSREYVAAESAMREADWLGRTPTAGGELPPEARRLDPATRLAWLMGRVTPDGLEPVRFG